MSCVGVGVGVLSREMKNFKTGDGSPPIWSECIRNICFGLNIIILAVAA